MEPPTLGAVVVVVVLVLIVAHFAMVQGPGVPTGGAGGPVAPN